MMEIENLKNELLKSIPTSKHKLFMDNLYFDYCDEVWNKDDYEYIPKREKITFQQLDRANIFCILNNHNPSWRDLTKKKIDIKHLREIGVFDIL